MKIYLPGQSLGIKEYSLQKIMCLAMLSIMVPPLELQIMVFLAQGSAV